MVKTRKRPMFCWECMKRTPCVYVGKKSYYEGRGLARGFAAVVSLGMSETTWADHYWQCEACGHIKKE